MRSLEDEGAGDEGDGSDHPVARLQVPDEIHVFLLGLLYYVYNTHGGVIQGIAQGRTRRRLRPPAAAGGRAYPQYSGTVAKAF